MKRAPVTHAISLAIATTLWGACASPPPPIDDPEILARVERVESQWKRLSAPDPVPAPRFVSVHTRLWVELDGTSLPGGALSSSLPVGQKLTAVAAGVHDSDDRQLIPAGSLFHGQVVEARNLVESPFAPARLTIHFYKYEDPREARAIPVSAIVESAGDWEVSSSGAVLGHRPIVLADKTWLGLRLLERVHVHQVHASFGPGIDATEWVGDRLRITKLVDHSSAVQQGLAIGDEIVEIEGTPLAGYLPWLLLYGDSGTHVDLRVQKPGEDQPQKVRLTRGLRSYEGTGLELTARDGIVRVTRVFPGSPAERAGVVSGSTILEAGGRPCDDIDTCASAMRLRAGSTLPLLVEVPGRRDPTAIELRTGRVEYLLR